MDCQEKIGLLENIGQAAHLKLLLLYETLCEVLYSSEAFAKRTH